MVNVSLPAKTAEDLVAAYKSAFESGDSASIEKMVYWGDVPVNEPVMALIFKTRIAKKGTGKVCTVELRDLDNRFDGLEFSLTPTKMMWSKCDYDGGQSTFTLPIGEVEGNFYLGTPKPN